MEEFNGDEHTEEVEAEVGGETGEEAAEEATEEDTAAEEKVAKEEEEAVEDTEEATEDTVIGSQNPVLWHLLSSISLILYFPLPQGFVSLELLLSSSPSQLWTILTHCYIDCPITVSIDCSVAVSVDCSIIPSICWMFNHSSVLEQLTVISLLAVLYFCFN